MVSLRSREFQSFWKATSEDIFKFCTALRFEPTWQQAQLLQDVQNAVYDLGPRRIAYKSGKGPGKTTDSVVCGCWRQWRVFNSLTMVTAPTMDQCKEVWMLEARRLLSQADPKIQSMISLSKTKIEFGGGQFPDWAVKFKTATKEVNAQGRHNPHMTYIVEEASGVARAQTLQIAGTLSHDDFLYIMIGNPNTRNCDFFDCFHGDRKNWKTGTWNAEESPNPPVSPERNRYLLEKYGRDHDVYRVQVLGEFPVMDPRCIMNQDDLEACTRTNQLACSKILDEQGKLVRQFGIDFARFGGDENVIVRRIGNAVMQYSQHPHTEPSDVVDLAFRMQRDAKWRDQDVYYVGDAGGLGGGVMSRFYDAGKNLHEFFFNGTANDPIYDNKATEAYFMFGDLIKTRNVYLPTDNRLIQQLSTRQYFTTRKGRLVLEPKDDFIKRTGESPDRADALVMAFYQHTSSNARISVGRASRRIGLEVES